jgi:ssDNA-binding replication factor A large subunit
MSRTVSVKGKDVKVKNVTIKDDTGRCKVALWREMADMDVSIGQHVKISDVVVTSYNNEKSVSTTSRTGLEVNNLNVHL